MNIKNQILDCTDKVIKIVEIYLLTGSDPNSAENRRVAVMAAGYDPTKLVLRVLIPLTALKQC